MWVDMLTQPKQGNPLKKDMSLLQNVHINYNNKDERKRSHPTIIPHHETHKKENMENQQAKPVVHHRSVLGIILNPSNGAPLGFNCRVRSLAFILVVVVDMHILKE